MGAFTAMQRCLCWLTQAVSLKYSVTTIDHFDDATGFHQHTPLGYPNRAIIRPNWNRSAEDTRFQEPFQTFQRGRPRGRRKHVAFPFLITFQRDTSTI